MKQIIIPLIFCILLTANNAIKLKDPDSKKVSKTPIADALKEVSKHSGDLYDLNLK